MKALILAAGYGTRLKPLTQLIPKCLAPVRGVPLLGIWLDQLISAGVEHIVVNLHYKDQLVRDYVASTPFRDRVTLVYEDTLSGTAGTLINNRHLFSNDVMVIHGDNLCHFNLRDFIAAHYKRPVGTVMTMMTFTTDQPENCGIVALDRAGVVQGFHEKVANPPGDLANGAVYLISQELLDSISNYPDNTTDLSTQVLPHLLGKIFTWHNKDYHRDIGSWPSLLRAQKDYNYLVKKELATRAWHSYWTECQCSKLYQLCNYLLAAKLYRQLHRLALCTLDDMDSIGQRLLHLETHNEPSVDMPSVNAPNIYAIEQSDSRLAAVLSNLVPKSALLLIAEVADSDLSDVDWQSDCLILSRGCHEQPIA